MAVGKEIRTKIKSVQNTQKITSAMEMVAASKMRRAQERMNAARPFAEKMRNVIGHLDDVEIEKVVDFERALLSYARGEHGELLGKINAEPVLNDATEQGLQKLLESFKANHAW